MSPPAALVDRRHFAFAVGAGLVCHLSFIAAVGAMMAMMLYGMGHAFGRVPAPASYVCNALLLLQYPLLHSAMLTRGGSAVLRRLAPSAISSTLVTTTYVILASWQTLALFLLWTPSGVVWWRATGGLWVALCALNVGAWLFLLKAILDAGISLQSGSLGWWAVVRRRAPAYPPMPRRGLFRWIRQPIYLGFALTLWTVPTWTPDQLVLAVILGGYCAFGPLLKEARFTQRYGEAFTAYRRATPFWIPTLKRARKISPPS